MKDILGKEIRPKRYVILPDLNTKSCDSCATELDGNVVAYPEYCDEVDSKGKTVRDIEPYNNGYVIIFTDNSYCNFSTRESQEDIDVERLWEVDFFIQNEVFSPEEVTWLKARQAEAKDAYAERVREAKLKQFENLKKELGL